MVKKRENCIVCGRSFWSKAWKNKTTGKVESLDNMCQSCKNRIRQSHMKRSPRLSEISDKFNSQITMRELYTAEMDRRKATDKAERDRVRRRK